MMAGTIRLAFDATATPVELTGAGYYVQQILAELDTRENVELSIITRKNDGERFASFAPRARIVDVAPTSRPARVGFQTTKLASVVDALDVDVFHGPHYQLPLNIATPSVVTIHDLTFLTHPDVHNRIKRMFFSRIIPRTLTKAKSVIAVSQHTADDVRSLFGETANVFVAPLGIDKNRFSPSHQENEEELLASRGIAGDYVAYLGLIEPRKSIPTLVNAFASIAEQFPDLRLVIAGSQGWGISHVRDSIAESGVATRIVLPGRLTNDEVGPYLRNARVFVYPSLYEGFGMPVAEAMACGTPTITSDSSSMKEVAGKGALLVKPGDANSLAEMIVSLLTHETLRKQMSQKALSRAADFSWEKCVDQHINAYSAASGG